MQGKGFRLCSNGCHLPRSEGIASYEAKGRTGGQMGLGIEGVVDRCVNDEESLGRTLGTVSLTREGRDGAG